MENEKSMLLRFLDLQECLDSIEYHYDLHLPRRHIRVQEDYLNIEYRYDFRVLGFSIGLNPKNDGYFYAYSREYGGDSDSGMLKDVDLCKLLNMFATEEKRVHPKLGGSENK